MLTTLRDALLAVLRRPLLLAALLIGNAVLLLMFYWWLSISEQSTGALAASAIVLVAVIIGVLWLYAMSLAAFHDPAAPCTVVALRRLPRFLPWAVLIGGVLYGAGWLASKSPVPFWVAGPLGVLVLLPMASQAAGGGFPAGAARRILCHGRYWIAGAIAVVLGVLAPKLLLTWIPGVSGLTAQSASLTIRFGIAFLLAALSWLMLAAFIGNIGRESGSQPA